MNVCIFGAGAIGGYLAASLARLADLNVSVIARGAQLQAIRARGLRLKSAREEWVAAVRATDNPSELGPQDYVFITVKENQIGGVLDTIAPLLGADTAVLPPTTGMPYWYFHGDRQHPDRRLERMDPDGRLWTTLDPARVIGCVYFTAATVLEPGVVEMEGGGAFPIGEPSGEKTARIAWLAEAMERAGIRAPVVEDIRGWIWMKVISSLCWNPVSVLTQATIGEIADSDVVASIIRRMLAEADAVAARLGVTIPLSGLERVGTVESNRRVPHHRASMLVDLLRGRALEIEVIVNSIESMQAIAGVETPTIDMILALTRLRAKTAAAQRA